MQFSKSRVPVKLGLQLYWSMPKHLYYKDSCDYALMSVPSSRLRFWPDFKFEHIYGLPMGVGYLEIKGQQVSSAVEVRSHDRAKPVIVFQS